MSQVHFCPPLNTFLNEGLHVHIHVYLVRVFNHNFIILCANVCTYTHVMHIVIAYVVIITMLLFFPEIIIFIKEF